MIERHIFTDYSVSRYLVFRCNVLCRFLHTWQYRDRRKPEVPTLSYWVTLHSAQHTPGFWIVWHISTWYCQVIWIERMDPLVCWIPLPLKQGFLPGKLLEKPTHFNFKWNINLVWNITIRSSSDFISDFVLALGILWNQIINICINICGV